MNEEYDVEELDLPEYEEEYSYLPDVKVDVSFAVDREEVYKRNEQLVKKDTAPAREEEFFSLVEEPKPSLLKRLLNADIGNGKLYMTLVWVAFAAVIVWVLYALSTGRL